MQASAAMRAVRAGCLAGAMACAVACGGAGTGDAAKADGAAKAAGAARADGAAKAGDATKADDAAKAGEAPKADGATQADGTAKTADAVAKADPAPPMPPPTPRPSLLYRTAPDNRIAVWQLQPSETTPHDLGIVADSNGGSLDQGGSEPLLSADGQWIAWLDHGRIVLQHPDGTARTQVTEHSDAKVSVLLSGFSPDSARLLFHQGEVQTEEGAPLPPDVTPGFALLTLADMKVAPVEGIAAFRLWHDAAHVITHHRQPDGSFELVRVTVATGDQEVLQRTDMPFGFGTPTVHGQTVAFVLHPHRRSQVMLDGLRGGAAVEVSTTGEFTQHQWTRLSPDGAHLAWVDDGQVRVVSVEAARASGGGKGSKPASEVVARCESRGCHFAWESVGTLLVQDDETLSRVGLDGASVEVASDVTGFTVAGQPA